MPPPIRLMILRGPRAPGNPRVALTPQAVRLFGRLLRGLLLTAFLSQASPALAQQSANPFDESSSPAGKRPYAGPQYPGKPPPLGIEAAPASPFADGPRIPVLPERLAAPGTRPVSSGTGFVVDDGRIITNNHVVRDCSSLVARNIAHTSAPARVLATDARRDLALLSVPTGFGPPLSFRNEPPVQRGETVVTYGYPLSGLATSGPTLTTGDLSALAGLRDNALNFQITAPVNPGNSGGPLLDSRGHVIGVIVSKLNALRTAQMTGGDIPQNVNFAIKGSEALAFLRENGAGPRTADSTGPDRRNTEIGDIANPSTVSLLCFR